MGGTDRCGILFYAGSTTTDIGLLLIAPAPCTDKILPVDYFWIYICTYIHIDDIIDTHIDEFIY
jgi:hypothetical protein